jgi:phosphoribosyl-ATP pyrophosphohydrolase
MATPRRIYGIYLSLAQAAPTLSDFLSAKGETVSSTVTLLVKRDRELLLRRWGEEMSELCGVLDGSHADPYLMEATQCFYWASLFAASAGTSWAALDFEVQRRNAVASGIATVPELLAACRRLTALGSAQAKPEKLFLLWLVADRLYRLQTRPDQQWSLEQLMEADLQEMLKRPYLRPFIEQQAE